MENSVCASVQEAYPVFLMMVFGTIYLCKFNKIKFLFK